MGWGVINMTAYPEGWLARELELCYANVSLITDYDVGLEDDPDVDPVSHEAVVKVFTENNERLRRAAVRGHPEDRPAARRTPARRRSREPGSEIRRAVRASQPPRVTRLFKPRPLIQSRGCPRPL